MNVRTVHYVGFKDDRFLNALRVFGRPAFYHRGWDLRAQRDVGEDDIVVFAEGEHDQAPKRMSYHDIDERFL